MRRQHSYGSAIISRRPGLGQDNGEDEMVFSEEEVVEANGNGNGNGNGDIRTASAFGVTGLITLGLGIMLGGFVFDSEKERKAQGRR